MSNDTINDNINSLLSVNLYKIRNLSTIMKNLMNGETTINNNLSVLGNIIVNNNSYLKGNNLTFLDKWAINVPQDDNGTLSVNHVKLNGTTNNAFGLGLYTNAHGDFSKGGIYNILPRGTILSFNGTTIPDTWALCNGQNGTPDLRGKFVLGMGAGKNLNTTGGAETHTLSVAELPAHDHTYSGKKIDHNIVCPGPVKNYVHYPLTFYPDNPLTGTSTAAGGGGAHNNMPPYYVLTYIMKIV